MSRDGHGVMPQVKGNRQESTVLVYQKGQEGTSEELRDIIKGNVDPGRLKVNIVRMHPIAKGGVTI